MLNESSSDSANDLSPGTDYSTVDFWLTRPPGDEQTESSTPGDEAQTMPATEPAGPIGDPLDASSQALVKDDAADKPGQADDLARRLDKMLLSLFGSSAANSLSGGGLSGLGSALPSGGAGGQGSSSSGAMPAAGLMSPSLMFAMQGAAQGSTAAGGTSASTSMAGIGEGSAALSAPQGGVASGQVAGAGGAPVLAALSSESAAGIAANVPLPPADAQAQAQSLLNNLPWRFEANVGQFAPQTQFVAHGPQYDVALSATQAQFAFTTAAPSTSADGSAPDAGAAASSSTSVITMQLVGGNASAQATGGAEVATKTNYFIGNDRSQWLTDVPNYASAQFRNVYQGINLDYYSNQGNLEHDFIVSPGADPNQIVTRIDGAEQVSLDGQGDLVIQTAAGPLVEQHPVAYQDVNGVRQDVSSQFVLLGGNEVGVSVGAYDHGNTLVIDPQWVYSSYLGGSGLDAGTGIYVDSTGSAYVVGTNSSRAGWGGNIAALTFAGAGVNLGGNTQQDVFVAKVAAGGQKLVYLDFLVGSKDDIGRGIAVDGSGNAYITGYTKSSDFPTVNPWQATYGGGFRDAFVAKLDPAGANLLFSTYLGGLGDDAGYGIAVDATSAQNIDVVGETDSSSFDPNNHATAPYDFGQGANKGSTDVLVAQFTNAGQLNWVADLGGNQTDVGNAVAVDQNGNLYITGYTKSYSDGKQQNAFPTTAGAFQTNSASPPPIDQPDAFVAEITVVRGAPTLPASTYFGGSGNDEGNGIVLGYDPSQKGIPLYVYVVGTTATDPTKGFGTGNILKPTVLGGANAWGKENAFVARFDANCNPTTAPYFVYLSGTEADYGKGIALTTAIGGTPKLYVTGETSSNNQAQKFPTPWSMQPYRGALDAFVALLDPNVAGAASLLFNTYVGGTGGDSGNGIAVDTNGNAYLTGRTDSQNMRDPRMPALPAFQPAFGGGNQDGFVMEISPVAPVAAPKQVGLGNQSIFDNTLLTFTDSATTYDGNAPNFFLDGAPSGASIDPNSGVFTWTPTPSQLGSWTFGVQAADAEGRIDEEFITVTVLLQPTTTNVMSSANPSPSGQPVTFTATVSASGGGTPTGTVTFLDGTTPLGTGTVTVVNGVDQATFTTSSLTSGSHAITAIYGGDPMYAGSSGMVAQTINQASGASTSTSLVSSASPSSFGQAVTFTATVNGSGGTPTGTVTFLDGTTVLGTGTLAQVNGQAQAAFTTATLVLGQHNITAIYGGDSTFAASSASLLQTVNVANTSVTLASSADPASYGSSVTFTATVNAPAGGTPTGSVTFVAGDTSLGTVTLTSVAGGAQASVTTSSLDFGDYPVFAVYGGDGNFTVSTSDPLDQIVN